MESKASSSSPPDWMWVIPSLGSKSLFLSAPPQHAVHPGTHHLLIGFLKKCFSKDRDDKDVDDKGDKECSAGLDEEVLVGLSYFLLTGPVHLPGLERTAAGGHYPPGAQSLRNNSQVCSQLDEGGGLSSLSQETPHL